MNFGVRCRCRKVGTVLLWGTSSERVLISEASVPVGLFSWIFDILAGFLSAIGSVMQLTVHFSGSAISRQIPDPGHQAWLLPAQL